MVRWPGTIVPALSNYAWAFWDVMPTLAELVGFNKLPDNLDGISILPTLMGRTQDPHEYLYWTWKGTGVPPIGADDGPSSAAAISRAEPTELGGSGGPSGYGVRVGDWKGVVPHCAANASVPSHDDPMQLYNLATDPFEATDVAAANADQVKKIIDLLISEDLSCGCFQC